MKKIAIVIDDITKLGGTERAITNLANILIKENRVSIVSITDSSCETPYFELNNKIGIEFLSIKTHNLSSLKKYCSYIHILVVLRKLIKIKNYDVLIGTGHAYNFLLPFAVKFYNAKSIATEHIARKSLPFTSKFLQRLSYPFLDCVVVLSQSAKNEYPFSKNLVVIPNSLPFDSIEQSELNHKTILTVGRLSYEKGIDRLLEVASLLNGKCDDWSIKIFGNGDIEDELREEVVKKGLSNFVFIHNAVINIQKEYLESAIYLMTSRFEAFPMVLLEAKSCGLPVIAYDCPEGPREIVNDGVDGFLIENGNVKDMAKKVLTLINDIDLRKTMGLNARNSLSKYKEQSISTLWFDLLNRI